MRKRSFILALCLLLCCTAACAADPAEDPTTVMLHAVMTSQTDGSTCITLDDHCTTTLLIIATDDSTCFSYIGYDDAQQVLFVRFRDSGTAYLYTGVPVDVWQQFSLRAVSKGRCFNTDIRGRYPCIRLDEQVLPAQDGKQ